MRWWILFPLMALAGAGSGQQPGSESAALPQAGPSTRDCGGEGTVPAKATILPGYGGGGFPITTQVPMAQVYFDDGMQLASAFASKGAISAMA